MLNEYYINNIYSFSQLYLGCHNYWCQTEYTEKTKYMSQIPRTVVSSPIYKDSLIPRGGI